MARDGHPRLTKLHATAGPRIASPATLTALVRAGVDGFRLNAAHLRSGEVETWSAAIRRVGTAAGKALTIRLDLDGPRVRCAPAHGGPVTLTAGSTVAVGGPRQPVDLLVSRPEFLRGINAGDMLVVDRGRIRLLVEKGGSWLSCQVVVGGIVRDAAPMAIEGRTGARLRFLTARDEDAIRAACAARIDLIALSFVQGGEDVAAARRYVRRIRGTARLMAKIETAGAISGFPDILDRADGISVSRGDLAAAIHPAERPELIERLIATARRAGKFAQVGGDLMSTWNATGTMSWAESTDLRFLIQQRVDGLSLSEETAIGRDPLLAVRMLDGLVRRWERQVGGFESRIPRVAAADAPGAIELSTARVPFAISVRTSDSDAGWLNAHWGVFPEVIATQGDKARAKE